MFKPALVSYKQGDIFSTIRLYLCINLDAFSLCLLGKDITHAFDDLRDIESLSYQTKHSITELSQVKQVVNKRLQQFKLVHHDGAVVVAVRDSFQVERCILEQRKDHIQEEDECLNGGSHLVTHCSRDRLCLHLPLFFLVFLQPLYFVDHL